jgi:hypothetical protein
VIRGLGILVAVVTMLIIGVRCFADEVKTPAKPGPVVAALPGKADVKAEEKPKEGTVAAVKAPERVEMGETIKETPRIPQIKKFWGPETSVYPQEDALTDSSTRDNPRAAINTLRHPSSLRFKDLPSGLRRTMPARQKVPTVINGRCNSAVQSTVPANIASNHDEYTGASNLGLHN